MTAQKENYKTPSQDGDQHQEDLKAKLNTQEECMSMLFFVLIQTHTVC